MPDLVARFIVLVSAIVPRPARREFRDEWHAELASDWRESGEAPARARARVRFLARAAGAVPDALALFRQEWSLDMLLQDLKYAVRLLSRRVGFTALVVLTLALGIGANTAVFSVLNGVLLRPLPFSDASQLVILWEDDRVNHKPRYPVAPANYIDWMNGNRSFERMAGFVGGTGDLTGMGEPVRLSTAVVWPDFFDVLRTPALLGRTLRQDDAKAGNFRVAVLSHRTWTTIFHGDPSVIDRTVQFGGVPYRIVGVMPAGFTFPDRETDLWRPLVLSPQTAALREVHFLRVIGRLAPGVSLDQARADMDAIARRQQIAYPKSNDQRGVTLVPLQDQIVGDVRRILYAIAGAVGIVLLIGCANVANLLLAAATGRRRELAVRAAMGAAQGRIVRQLLVEALTLALAGGALGLAIAVWATRLLARLGAEWLPRAEQLSIDVRVLAFAVAISVLTAILFALLPAVQASRADLHEVLKDGGRSGDMGRGARRAGRLLVIGELALAVALLVAAGLVLRSFIRLQDVAPGFNAAGVLAADIDLPESRYPDDGRVLAFQEGLLERARALPGVEAAGIVSALPMTGSGATAWLTIEGRPRPAGEPPEVGLRGATPGYFAAMGIPLLQGRTLEAGDHASAGRVVVVNRALAERFFPDQSPIGAHIRLGPNPKAAWNTIVGVVGDVRETSLETEGMPAVYRPMAQDVWSSGSLVLRTTADPHSLVPALRAIVQTLDRDLPLGQIDTMAAIVGETTVRRRVVLGLIGAFAALALLLATIGVYGVLAYSVSQRRQEIGVRIALGARIDSVIAMIVRQGLVLAVVGLGLGLMLALALNRVVAVLLFAVEPTDPATYAAVSAVVLAVAAVACYVPARRAAGVDPVEAIRN